MPARRGEPAQAGHGELAPHDEPGVGVVRHHGVFDFGVEIFAQERLELRALQILLPARPDANHFFEERMDGLLEVVDGYLEKRLGKQKKRKDSAA